MVRLGLLEAGRPFCPIITKVDRKIASRLTTRVSVGHGDFTKTSIQAVKMTAWG